MKWMDCDMRTFIHHSEGKVLFCLGAGRRENRVMQDTKIKNM